MTRNTLVSLAVAGCLLAAALTLWSMGYYLGKAWPEIKNRAF